MIFNAPSDWKDLQDKVCSILNQVGFLAETSKTCETPRGQVELDVYAVDPNSIDKITYVLECKNWETRVSQTIIHAFTTVMHETGAHIGYIISKAGFQSGAYDYITNTNISVFMFSEFQNKYLNKWLANYFGPTIYAAGDSVIHYTEPINSRRDRFERGLNEAERKQFRILQEKYTPLCYTLLAIGVQDAKKGFYDFNKVLEMLNAHSGRTFTSTCFSDLLDELAKLISEITDEFNRIFGKDIFKEN